MTKNTYNPYEIKLVIIISIVTIVFTIKGPFIVQLF